jgi:hypothetical protein
MSGERETRLPWERQPGESEQAWREYEQQQRDWDDQMYQLWLESREDEV